MVSVFEMPGLYLNLIISCKYQLRINLNKFCVVSASDLLNVHKESVLDTDWKSLLR